MAVVSVRSIDATFCVGENLHIVFKITGRIPTKNIERHYCSGREDAGGKHAEYCFLVHGVMNLIKLLPK